MKKIILLLFVATLFSCGASKNVRSKEKTIKGNWKLTNIAFSKTGNYNVTLFGDASKECLEGSSWKFVPNNNSGTYTIESNSCVTGERDFIFVVQEIDEISGYYDFLLKPKENNKEKIGYRLSLKNLTETTMLLQQNLNINGAPFLINMNFTKQ